MVFVAPSAQDAVQWPCCTDHCLTASTGTHLSPCCVVNWCSVVWRNDVPEAAIWQCFTVGWMMFHLHKRWLRQFCQWCWLLNNLDCRLCLFVCLTVSTGIPCCTDHCLTASTETHLSSCCTIHWCSVVWRNDVREAAIRQCFIVGWMMFLIVRGISVCQPTLGLIYPPAIVFIGAVLCGVKMFLRQQYDSALQLAEWCSWLLEELGFVCPLWDSFIPLLYCWCSVVWCNDVPEATIGQCLCWTQLGANCWSRKKNETLAKVVRVFLRGM